MPHENRPKILFGITVVILAVLLIIGFFFFRPKTKDLSGEQGLLGRPLKVGIVSWPGYAGGIVANDGFKPNKNCIYYKDHNIMVEFVLLEDADLRAKSFVRGGKNDVDVVWSTVDFWANELPGFVKGGVPARAFLQVDWSKGADAIVADSSIKSVEQLAGRKVALAQLTPSDWFYEYVMRHSAISEQQVRDLRKTIVGKNASPDARQDFVANQVDACVVWEPDVANALKERKGSHVLVSSAKYNHILSDLMVAREDFINTHPEVIQAFVDGWFDGAKQAKANPQYTAKLLMENEPLFNEIGEEKTLSIMNNVDLTELGDNVKMFGVDGTNPLLYDLFREAGGIWLDRKFIEDTLSPQNAVTDRFIRNLHNK
ncbi:MAG: ABC transporter substrate-binding protein [Chitinophagaceae bacterium]